MHVDGAAVGGDIQILDPAQVEELSIAPPHERVYIVIPLDAAPNDS